MTATKWTSNYALEGAMTREEYYKVREEEEDKISPKPRAHHKQNGGSVTATIKKAGAPQ